LPAQEGDGLCWGDWDAYQCLAGKPTPEEREDRIRAEERAKVVEEIAACLDRGPHGFQSRHAFAGYIRAEFGAPDTTKEDA